MSSRAVCPVTTHLCIEGCLPAACRRMNAPTSRARAHLRPVDHDIFGGPIYDPVDLMIQAAPLPSYAAREHDALSHLTDAQALATWERMKAVRKAYVEAVLQEIAE